MFPRTEKCKLMQAKAKNGVRVQTAAPLHVSNSGYYKRFLDKPMMRNVQLSITSKEINVYIQIDLQIHYANPTLLVKRRTDSKYYYILKVRVDF